jgi:hypothetical protein
MSTAKDGALSEKPKPASFRFWQWRQILLITIGSVALYVVVRRLPTGTNLSHMDFRAGANSIEFCDPANPQFMPVVAVRSPVAMTLVSETPAMASHSVQLVLSLKTSNGKPVTPEDLLVVHTQKLHLLIVDPTLTDYQHVHPQPGKRPGEWLFTFTPRRAGTYRVFADFTPVATARGLYASADLEVKGANPNGVSDPERGKISTKENWVYEDLGYRFSLQPSTGQIRAGKITDLKFMVTRADGGSVPMQPVMGAYAHLVAFDAARSGFAHLHPNETDLARTPDPKQPKLTFKFTIPRAGRYVIWAQVNLAGQEVFAPFWFEVLP